MKWEGLRAKRNVLSQHKSADEPPSGAVCCWWEDDAGCGVWVGNCGVVWQFMSDGPNENGMAFCPRCGRPLHIADEVGIVEDGSHDNIGTWPIGKYLLFATILLLLLADSLVCVWLGKFPWAGLAAVALSLVLALKSNN